MNIISRFLGIASISAIALMLTIWPVQPVIGAEFAAPDDNGNITLSANETRRNLYTAGGSVLINSTVLGDIYVAGGDVTIEGSVEGDVVVLAGSAYINGVVGGDVRAIAGDVTINNTVAGDVVLFGGTVNLSDRAAVAKDVVIDAGNIKIAGPIAGSLTAKGSMVEVNSAVTGAVAITAYDKLTIGPNAVFGENAKYKSWQEAKIADGALVSNLSYEPIDRKRTDHFAGAFTAIFSIGFIIKLLAMIFAGLLLINLFPRKAYEFVNHLDVHKWSNLGVGFIGLIVMPIAAIIALITFIGFYAGVILFLLWILWIVVGSLIGTVYAGTWVYKLLTKRAELVLDWQAVVIGVVTVAIIGLVPVVGWLIVIMLSLAGFGTILSQIGLMIKSQQTSTPPVINNEQ